MLLAQGRMYTLPDVWIRPTFAGRGRKVSGQLEAHTNGFRYSNPKGETLDIMYRYALPNCWCFHGYKYRKTCCYAA